MNSHTSCRRVRNATRAGLLEAHLMALFRNGGPGSLSIVRYV